MIFSRIGRSLSRSSNKKVCFNRNPNCLILFLFYDFFLSSFLILFYFVQNVSKFLNEAILRSPYVDTYIGRFDGQLGFVRGYLATIGANKEFGSKGYLSDLNYVLANPRIRRFFSSEAPKKKSELLLSCLSVFLFLILVRVSI